MTMTDRDCYERADEIEATSGFRPIILAGPEDDTIPWIDKAVRAGGLRKCGGCQATDLPHYHVRKRKD